MAPTLHDKTTPPKNLSDDDLLRRLSELLQQSRRIESQLVAHIGEVDARRLFASQACPSMFVFCTDVLHLSEAEAYLRIAAARAARRHPILLDMLRDGRLHLSGIALLAPHLTEATRDKVLTCAAHKSKRQIKELIAELAPQPDVPTVVRKLPERRIPAQPPAAIQNAECGQLRPDGVVSTNLQMTQLCPDRVILPPPAAAKPAKVVEPLAPSRYKIQFTANAELHEKLHRLGALTGSTDIAAVIDAAVTEKLQRLEARRYGKVNKPRKSLDEASTSPSSRYIPAPVRRVVRERCGAQCTFIDPSGRRCTERNRLEFHHQRPFALGGDHSEDNIVLMCRAHNNHLAERDYGKEKMAWYRDSGNRVSESLAVYAVLTPRSPPLF